MSQPSRKPHHPPRVFRLPQLLLRHPSAIVGASLIFALVMLALFALVLWQARQDAQMHAIGMARNIALVVERDVTRTVHLYDLALQEAADGAADPAVLTMPPKYQRALLFDRAFTASEYHGEMLYADEKGNILVDSAHLAESRVNVSQQAWYQVQRAHPGTGLFISKPIRSSLTGGEPALILSRRVNRPDGSFGGVVAGTISLQYFHNLLSGLNLGDHGAAGLVQTDGTLVMRYPVGQAVIGHSFRNTPNFQRVMSASEGHFFGTDSTDRVHRLYVYKRFNDAPFVIAIAPAAHDVYSAWVRRAAVNIPIAALLACAFVAMAILLSGEFRRRLHIETELRLLLRTDGLTGLSNRRNLDDVLTREWKRAQRSRKPMSLIFIDIDWFKAYNDTYGHQAGDDTLVAIAQAISRSIHRPYDIAARYGGEEFVVVLPETGVGGAAFIAAAIHLAVRALQIEHRPSEHHTVTVSIGAATWEGSPMTSVLDLMKLADEALYQAKSNGRNTTCATRCTPESAATADSAHYVA